MDSALTLVLGIVLSLLVIFGLVFGIVFVILKRVAQHQQNMAQHKYPDARFIDSGALFFGQQSRGAMQMRGNGTLIITPTDVIFHQWIPGREFHIPLKAIQSIENPTSFLGKWQGVPLLKVNFLNEKGQTEAMAWRVRDLSGIQRAIEDARTLSRAIG
ncbi:MAG: hypothetical protein KA314_02825 [Chloroflexi bacterium]|nr:hypothetical protein [Chloroflexota bacterium]MBP8054743.1 hypothetical protein [Chloroflexota bacterium]